MSLERWGGGAFVVAGVCLALWPAVHPWNQLAGAHAGQSTAWAISHGLHFLAGLFGCYGLVLLFTLRREALSSGLGAIAFLTAFTGTTLFTSTGVFTAFLWPVLAQTAPTLVEQSGPFFTPPHPLIMISAVLLSAGYMLLAVVLRLRGLLSTTVTAVVLLGFALLLVPPPPLAPVPWLLFVAAGVLAGVGLVGLGSSLRAAEPVTVGARP